MTDYVITGCSQSGTMYAAELLTGCGLGCGHESVFDWGRRFQLARQPGADRFAGDASYIVAPYVQRLAAEGMVIVHLVRPPLDVIRSTMSKAHLHLEDPPPYVRFIDHHIPGLLDQPPGPLRGAWYWLRWNALVEPHAKLTWPLGAVDVDSIEDLCHHLGYDTHRAGVVRALEDVPRDVNSNDPLEPAASLEDLGELADEVIEAAERYGVPVAGPPRFHTGGIISKGDAPIVGEVGPEGVYTREQIEALRSETDDQEE